MDERYQQALQAMQSRTLPDFGGLIVDRKEGERVVVESPDGVLIVITLYCIKSGSTGAVQVLAPKEWRIDREEVWERRERERVASVARRSGNR